MSGPRAGGPARCSCHAPPGVVHRIGKPGYTDRLGCCAAREYAAGLGGTSVTSDWGRGYRGRVGSIWDRDGPPGEIAGWPMGDKMGGVR
jgi:hypothetical protein